VATLDAHDAEVPDGAASVHMFIPSWYDGGTTAAVSDAWQARRPGIPFINLVDRDQVGDYSDPDFFVDFWHLSEVGSEAVSRAAGAQLCPVIAQRITN
jgi:hypothetical protein